MTDDDVKEALKPLASLLAKSEKARLKVTPGLWQHRMLDANITALRLALSLLEGRSSASGAPTADELAEAGAALDAMIERVEGTKATFAAGTSQHSLQRNRLDALRVARSAVNAAMGGEGAGCRVSS